MTETSHDVRRELAVTRERVGSTIAALERKVNPKHWLEDYPLPAIGVAFGAGALLGGTGMDRMIVHNMKDGARPPEPSAPGTGQEGHGTIERLMEGVTAALISAGTAKLMQLMDSMAGQHTGVPRPPERSAAAQNAGRTSRG